VGCDASSFLPASTRLPRLYACLRTLGYRRLKRSGDDPSDVLAYFVHAPSNDYQHYVDLYATVRREDEGVVEVHTRTTVWRSRADSDHHNTTIRTLRERFGGHFESDEGRNRYLVFSGVERTPPDAGCFLSYWQFTNNLARARAYVAYRQFPESLTPHEKLWFTYLVSPVVLSNNMLRVYLLTLFEEYVRATFVALLRYSERREQVFGAARLQASDLVAISTGATSVEQAIATSHNFQNIRSTLKRFQELDPKLDLNAALVRPFRRRTQTFLQFLEGLVAARNEFIHRGEIDYAASEEAVKAELSNVHLSVDRIYTAILKRYGWTDERPL
jgi:hypothetical protein